MADRTAVAESVARACTASAGTVQALAEEVGVSYAALCSWSRGRRQPPDHRLRTLADVMESRADRLRELAVELRSHTDEPRRDAPRPEPEPLRVHPQGTGSAPPLRRPWAASGPERGRQDSLSAR